MSPLIILCGIFFFLTYTVFSFFALCGIFFFLPYEVFFYIFFFFDYMLLPIFYIIDILSKLLKSLFYKIKLNV